MKENLVLCAIAKCENKYIKEWVQWHFNIGFDKIVVYDNNDVDGEKISDVIGDVPCVEIVDWRGKTQKSCETQVAAYNDCYKRHMNSKWIMFLDIDEFLEFKEGIDLVSFLEQNWVKRANDIKFHWKCYSDSGYINAPEGPVTENFTEECKNKAAVNCYVKHIYKCGLPKLNIVNVHYSSSLTNVFYQNGKTAPYLTITVDKNINHDVGWIRHYVTKSMEEFVFTKYARRGPGTSKNRLNVDFYFKYNERTPEKERKLREMIAELEPSKKESKPIVKQEKPKKESKTSWVIEPYYANKSYPGKSKEPTKKPSVYDLQNKKAELEPSKKESKPIVKQEKPKKESKTSWVIEPYYANKSYPGKSKEPTKKPSVYDLQNKKADKQNILINSGENYPSGVSVCISAWKTAEYIEECLDSVANQTWFKDHDNWEILLGIDGCEETLTKVKEIMHKYKNLKVMMMDKNVGTYVTCNTIMKEANYEWLLRFDSDDTMPKDMIAKIFANDLKNIDLIQYKHITTGFSESQGIAFGSHMVKKEIWEKYGGYQSWRICADYDFVFRIETDIKTKKLDNVYYNRFSHNDSLQFSKETDMKSEIRIKYNNYVKNETRKHKIIKLNTTNFYLFYDSTPLILFALPNRGSKNIKYVVDNLKKTYSTYNIKIVIINQFDDVIFKRGQLYNIILKEYDCDFVVMCDNDIIHFNKIKLLSEYYKQNKPFLGFDFISQVKIENEKPIVTSTKANTTGCGAFLFAKKEDLLNIYGYSNLYLGWGCEDNEISCRLCNDNNYTPQVRRIHNTIGHITHPKRNEYNIYERNRNILETREKRMIKKDGINQTTYDIIKKEIIDDVEYLYVTNIGVTDDFEYKNLLKLN